MTLVNRRVDVPVTIDVPQPRGDRAHPEVRAEIIAGLHDAVRVETAEGMPIDAGIS
jgi:hypothetical protein